jgi:hypothetical protein
MNYEDLNKDESIKLMVKYFSDKYGEGNFKIKDHWDADSSSIGLIDISEKYLIYISIYGTNKGHYYVSLENLSETENFAYEPDGDFDEVDFENLERYFIQHLRIKTINAQHKI